jgi:hypothetical protein
MPNLKYFKIANGIYIHPHVVEVTFGFQGHASPLTKIPDSKGRLNPQRKIQRNEESSSDAIFEFASTPTSSLFQYVCTVRIQVQASSR